MVAGQRENEEKAVVQTIEKTGEKPTTASQVIATAFDAHLVVFANCDPESLPFWGYEWLERWAVSRRVADAALALTEGGCGTELRDAASELSQLARKRQLTLIVNENSTVVTASNPKNFEDLKAGSPRAQESVLDTFFPNVRSLIGHGIHSRF